MPFLTIHWWYSLPAWVIAPVENSSKYDLLTNWCRLNLGDYKSADSWESESLRQGLRISFNESLQVSPLCSRVDGQSQIVCPLFPIATASLATPVSNNLMGASSLLLHLLILPFILTSSWFTHTHTHTHIFIGFPGGTSGKEPTCQCRRQWFDPWVRKIPWRRHGNSLQYSCLNPQSIGLQRVGHDWSNVICTYIYVYTHTHYTQYWHKVWYYSFL